MTVYNSIILACWLVFLAVWAIAAFSAKPGIGRRHSWWLQGAIRLAILIALLLALRSPAVRQSLRGARPFLANRNTIAGIIGDILCILGVSLAIWARLTLGRDWGMPMTAKAEPELVTRGPYAFIRHPIYAGILLGTLGSVIGLTLVWIVPLISCAVYFFHSARREEKLMLEQFPTQYDAYRRRTKMLVPFLF